MVTQDRWSFNRFRSIYTLPLNDSSFFHFAVICFEGTPLVTFSGTFYRFSGEESDGQICVNVTREEDEVNMFDYESFQYVVSEVLTPIFGDATAAGEFVGGHYTEVLYCG